MRLIFTTSNLPVAALIRAVTWSDWSHVGIIDGDNVIEAVWPRVKLSPLADKMSGRYAIADIACDNPDAVIVAARSQIGKPYDFTALFGYLTRRNWQDDDSWFCSELAAWSFDKAGCQLFRPNSLHRITPQHLWMISK